MQLHTLHRTPCLTIFYDSGNDWLFLDWQGRLTLPLVQEACLALAACFLHRAYPRVLNNNERVTAVSWNVAPWLAIEFLPHMRLAGIEQVAWVHSESLLGQHMMQTILTWLPGPIFTRFSDLEEASAWLTRLRLQRATDVVLPTRSAATQRQLAAIAQDLTLRFTATQQQAA